MTIYHFTKTSISTIPPPLLSMLEQPIKSIAQKIRLSKAIEELIIQVTNREDSPFVLTF